MSTQWCCFLSVVAVCLTICYNIYSQSFRFNYMFIKRCVNDYVENELKGKKK